jgi:transposase
LSIIHQKDKRSGITYAYESTSYWDREKKQSRAKRTLIGRVDTESGAIRATDGRCRKGNPSSKLPAKRGPVTAETTARRFCGATFLLDKIGQKLGIRDDLKQCFPDICKQILSLAYYLVLECGAPLYRFEKWNILHRHPYGKDISSQRSSELFASIKEGARQKFFRLQGQRRSEGEYWAYDTTSISSYSEQLSQAQYGLNKEDDNLPQINLALLFGEDSNLPFYYRKLAGNIPDVKTLKELLEQMREIGFSKVKLVMDRGFYSESNVNACYKNHLKFLMAARMGLAFIRDQLDLIYDEFKTYDHYSQEHKLYAWTVTAQWHYEEIKPRSGSTINETRRIYIHYYYNADKAADAETSFDSNLAALYSELISGNPVPKHIGQYDKWFTSKNTRGGVKAEARKDLVASAKRYFGYFALISNETMDAVSALRLYRNKDVVEKAFGNLKERLNMRRTLVSSEQALDGKLFVAFVSLIYLSHIKKLMQDAGLYNNYTMQELLDKLDIIECFENPGTQPRVGEILKQQKAIYTRLGFEPPTSL